MKVYIIHVSDHAEREVHIRKQIEGRDLSPVFINRGDIKDLTPSVMEKYFTGEMADVAAPASCAYKHILACAEINRQEDDLVMILEDDMFLYRNFSRIVKKILKEVENKKIQNFILSLEDSTLKYIPRSKRKKTQLVYRETRGRTTGAYLIDKKGAGSLLRALETEKMEKPIGWFHNKCVESGKINMFWSQPAVCCQGSFDGSMKSLISEKKLTVFRPLTFRIQKIYKKFLYEMR